MKNNKLKLFMFFFLIIILINSFLYNILNGWLINLFLFISLIIFKILFGFERNNLRYTKRILLDTTIYLLSFFIIYYLSGLLLGFIRNDYYNLNGFINFTLNIFVFIILKELLRFYMLKKSEYMNKSIFYITGIFILLDITNSLIEYSFTSKYKVFLFILYSWCFKRV